MVYSGATGDCDTSTYGVQWCNWGLGHFNSWCTVVQLGIVTLQLMVYSGATGIVTLQLMVYSGATGDCDTSTYGVQWCNWGLGHFNLWCTVVQLGIGTIQLMVYSGATGDLDNSTYGIQWCNWVLGQFNLWCTVVQLGIVTLTYGVLRSNWGLTHRGNFAWQVISKGSSWFLLPAL